MVERKYVSAEIDRAAKNGLCGKPKGRDAQMLPSAEAPAEKLVKKSLPNEDPLKTCILERLNEGGRNEIEAEKWCRDYLMMKSGNASESAACDSANLREAERVFMDTKERLKPWYLEKCVAQRQRLFGENQFEAKRRCVIDYEISERVHGIQYEADKTTLHQCCDIPESFHKQGVLVLQLDDRTKELMEQINFLASREGVPPRHYTEIEADRKARTELGLPQIDHPQKPEPDATMEVFGKTKEARIKEIYAVDNVRRPGERLISPFSGVPNLYGKSRKQVLEEVYEMDRQDREAKNG
jgi:hypothetical protein